MRNDSPLGKIVTVSVDRPLGFVHPKHPNLVYPINYGYVPNIIAADGEEQDAYIIGVNEPIESFTGEVVAVIHRMNDVEEKWVVAPIGASFTEQEILELTKFQEQYFNIRIISK